MAFATSFIEISVGVGVIGVLLVGTTTALSTPFGGSSAKYEATRLRLELEYATILAARFGHAVTVTLDGNIVQSVGALGTALRRYELNENVVATPSSASVTILPTGVASPLTFKLNDTRDVCRVVISLRSRCRVECS